MTCLLLGVVQGGEDKADGGTKVLNIYCLINAVFTQIVGRQILGDEVK